MSKFVAVGQIVNVHGIKGAVKIKPYLKSPRLFRTFGALTDKEGKRTFHVKIIGQKKDCLLAAITGIEDRTTAETLKGMELFAEHTQFPATQDHEFYYTDLTGLTVLKDGQVFGQVRRVDNFGAGDVVEVALTDGKIVPFSFSRTIFPKIDLAAGTAEIVIPAGMEDVL